MATDVCPRKKCGEFNMLKCCRESRHDGQCNFVVDHENDYPWNKERQKKNRRKKG